MKSNKKNGMFQLLAMLLFAAVGIVAMPHHVEAKEVSVPKTTYMDITSDAKKYGVTVESAVDMKNYDWNKDKITAVSVSNPAIVQVKKGQYSANNLYPKKAGKTKLTITVQHANGKEKKLQTTLVTQQYKNPLKTFKIGKYSYIKLYKKKAGGQRSFKDNEVKGKLQVKAAKGWTLVNIKKRYYDESARKWKLASLKNGKTYKFLRDDMVIITLKDKKTKFIRTCRLDGMG